MRNPFRRNECTTSPDGKHHYQEESGHDTRGAQGGCYVHGYRMSCRCGSKVTGTYEVEEYR